MRGLFRKNVPRLLAGSSIGAIPCFHLIKGHNTGNLALADTNTSRNNNFIADAAEVASPSVVNITCDMKVAKFLAGVS